MATKIPFTGNFKVTCEYGRKGTAWASGMHQGTDLVGITNKKVYSICNGVVERAGYDNGGFGNYVRIKEDGTENQRNNRIIGTDWKPGRTFRIPGYVQFLLPLS